MPKKCLLKDPYFKRGFHVRGLGGSPENCMTQLDVKFGQALEPEWNYCQWAARYNLADPKEGKITEVSDGVFRLETKTNTLLCDTNNKTLIFTCNASKCYDKPRTADQPWQHLLIETGFTSLDAPDDYTSVARLKSLVISGKVQLLKFEDHMGDFFDEEIHAAQFLMFLTIHNGNKESKGFGEMIWFGINFFDNRYEWSEYTAMFDKGTACLMVGNGNRPVYPGGKSFFENGKIIAGEDTPEYAFEIEAVERIKSAYETARQEGYFQNTEFEDLYVTGMNLGWEMPGTYDVSMKLRDFDITVEY